MRTFLLILIATAACSGECERTTPAPAAKATLPALAAATQDDLARELDAAERRGTWNEVRRRWQGQKLRWTVTRHRMLCRSAASCNVAVFPIGRADKHGWMPTLEMSAEQFAALDAECGADDSCRITIEGTLSKLELSGDKPTSLRFTDVRVVGAVTAQR